MSESKTGRKAAQAAAAMNATAKVVITDEKYVKNLRDDLTNGRYVAQEGARALLREYDVAKTQRDILSKKYDDLTTFLAHEVKVSPLPDEDAIQSAIRHIRFLTEREEQSRKEAEQSSQQEHEYAAELGEIEVFITREIGEQSNEENTAQKVVRIIRGYLTKDKRNAEIAAVAPFADHLIPTGDVVVGVDLANGSDHSVVVGSSHDLYKDAIGE